MNDKLIELLEHLRGLDPDEVVDYLSIDTDTLVDHLLPYADEWLEERGGEFDDE